MFIDKRGKQILDELVRNPYLKSKDLEEKHGLTKRQVQYSIDKLNKWLGSEGLPEITQNFSGGFLIDKEVLRNLARLEGAEHIDYLAMDDERALLIILRLLSKESDISLFHLSELLMVSKNTVLADLRLAKTWIEAHGLSIHYSRIDGYSLAGEEIEIRKFIHILVPEILHMYNGDSFFVHYADLDISEMALRIQQIEEELRLHYSDESFDTLVYILLLNERRIATGNFLSEDDITDVLALKDTKEYRAALLFMMEGQQKEAEKNWITIQFLTSNVRYTEFEEVDDEVLRSAVYQMLLYFEGSAGVVFGDKDAFANKLFHHIRPAVYRVKYGLTLNQYISDVIKEQYAELYQIVRKSVEPIEQLTGVPFPPEELAFIVAFIGAELINQGFFVKSEVKAIVVCYNGLSVSRMLKMTLETLFPNFVFTNPVSIRQFYTLPENYDIVFSTVPLETSKPVYLVDPIMTLGDKTSLKARVERELNFLGGHDGFMLPLMDIIGSYAKVEDEDGLYHALSSFFESGQYIREETEMNGLTGMPELSRLLPKENIQIAAAVDSWEEGIRVACEPLIRSGAITSSYRDELIRKNDTKDIYCFLGEHMIIPHDDPENGVSHNSFAMLVLKEPVMFQNGKKASLIVPLAIKDANNHLKAITQLANIAEDRETVDAIVQASDIEVIAKIIEKV